MNKMMILAIACINDVTDLFVFSTIVAVTYITAMWSNQKAGFRKVAKDKYWMIFRVEKRLSNVVRNRENVSPTSSHLPVSHMTE